MPRTSRSAGIAVVLNLGALLHPEVRASSPADLDLQVGVISVDLSCPAEQINVTVLEGSDTCLGGIDTCGRVAGVEACGRKATYVNVKGTWIQNTDSEPAE